MYDSNDSNIVTKGPANHKKSVILTFDDGPSRVLPDILDILKSENVPAMFFWQSRLLFPKRPWKRVLDEGHIIGTHTVKHPNLVRLTYEKQYQELSNSVTKIEDVTGQPIKYFRPPFGQYNADTLKAAEQLQLTPVLWRVAAIDWELKEEPEQIITNVTDYLEDGAVILLHELRQTLDVLPDLIKTIKAEGYGFTQL
ncbi:polysaccharide deacetylase family protein [Tuberibacillus sp. Marseille-P3662]|uniref:polysaccharide deacetylase family protein n=1 Tax=Tuberibacillus sp. Marseille-P3662 TaxID=1965358 RepID=UPI000A1CC442|nr:polysaccharide deacetylase family protein [Tuberibacillus sp. Marseille-P3662]